MSEITHIGMLVHTSGVMPTLGSKAPDFELVKSDLSVATLKDYQGKKIILNIFPSLDTGTCAASVREFNRLAADLSGTVVLCVSADLPFAHKRFCETANINAVITLSDFRDHAFGRDYGLTIVDGLLKGLLARAVIVLNDQHKITYQELVPEIAQEPDYQSALKAIG
jgi:thiol peroxidase